LKNEIETVVLATGGLAILFDKHTDAFDVIEPDLTILGACAAGRGTRKCTW
jgi:type III pantothenate kinase